jgi:hypothetical protein
MSRVLSVRNVLSRTWQVMSRWQGTDDARGADILLEPLQNGHWKADFDSFNEMLEAGRRTAEERMEMIQTAVASTLRPAG